MRDTYIQSVNDAMSNSEVVKPVKPIFEKGDIISEDCIVSSVEKKPFGDIFIIHKKTIDSPEVFIVKKILPKFNIGEQVYYYNQNIEDIGKITHCFISKDSKYLYQIEGYSETVPETDLHRESIVKIKRREEEAKQVPATPKDFTKQNSENKHLINDVCRAAMISSQYDYYNSRYRGESNFEIMEGTIFNYNREKHFGIFKPTQTMARLLSSVDERHVPNFLSRKASRFAALLQEAYRDHNEPLYRDAYSCWQKKYHGSQKEFLIWVLEKMEAENNE